MEKVDSKTKGYYDTIGLMLKSKISAKDAASMLVNCGYSSNIESAMRTVELINNDISNFRLSKIQ